MLQVARLSPRQLGDARELVRHFLLDQRHPDGGFRDRAGQSDIYYTVFGLEGLVALQADLPRDDAGGGARDGAGKTSGTSGTSAYLTSFGAGERLDFVHVACLARAWATLSAVSSSSSPRAVGLDERTRDAIAARIEAFRAADGGYAQTVGAARGTVYAAFLAVGAYQDLRRTLPAPGRLIASIAALRARDGGFANHPEAPVGLTTSTAAAVAIHRQLERGLADDADRDRSGAAAGAARAGGPGGPNPPGDLGEVGAWLLARAHPQGGFVASPTTPMPDLLSTATALHALASLHVPIGALQESCLDFVDTLWTNRGGFYGHWADDHVDCEYTYYGLLALGHLSL